MFKFCLIIFSIFFLVSVAGADDYCPRIDKKKSKPNKRYETVDPVTFIPDAEPLFVGGDVYCVIDGDILNRVNRRIRLESGVYEGLLYRVYHLDGGGKIQGQEGNDLSIKDKHDTNWRLRCSKDDFDDSHTCALSRGDLTVGLTKDGSPYVLVGNSHYPGTTVTIRIDQDQPIVASEESHYFGEAAKPIVERLMTAQRVLTRYQEWPYKANIDKSFEPFGFAQAWQIMNRVFEQGR